MVLSHIDFVLLGFFKFHICNKKKVGVNIFSRD